MHKSNVIEIILCVFKIITFEIIKDFIKTNRRIQNNKSKQNFSHDLLIYSFGRCFIPLFIGYPFPLIHHFNTIQIHIKIQRCGYYSHVTLLLTTFFYSLAFFSFCCLSMRCFLFIDWLLLCPHTTQRYQIAYYRLLNPFFTLCSTLHLYHQVNSGACSKVILFPLFVPINLSMDSENKRIREK